MDLEEVLAEFQMEYFCWVGVPFGLVWVGDRTPNFTAIKKNWGDDTNIRSQTLTGGFRWSSIEGSACL